MVILTKAEYKHDPNRNHASSNQNIVRITFLVALTTIAKKQKEPKCPPAIEYIHRLWLPHHRAHAARTNKDQCLSFRKE